MKTKTFLIILALLLTLILFMEGYDTFYYNPALERITRVNGTEQ